VVGEPLQSQGNEGSKRMSHPFLSGSMAVCLSLALGTPTLAAAPRLPAQQTRSAPTPLPIDRRADDKLRAAAEPFEKLTEIAFTATPPVIDRTIREAAAAARDVRRWLSSSAATRLDAQIAAVKSARRKRDHAGLALASIEAYRVLVGAVANDARIPTEVSLLDYAGFRYGADLKADPARCVNQR